MFVYLFYLKNGANDFHKNFLNSGMVGRNALPIGVQYTL